jgi:IS605 OrfB family transposase
VLTPLYYYVIAIKLKLTESINIEEYQKQFTSIRNYAFNRFIEGHKSTSIEHMVKTKLNNIDLMDVSLQKEAVNEARTFIRENQKTVVFGGKKNRKDYLSQKITKEEYQQRKLSSIIVRGETGRGNRKFQLDTINHQVIFKPNQKTKIYCKYEKTKQDKVLNKLQKLCDLGTTYFTARLAKDYVYIMFDETILKEKEYKPIKKRICAIDLNPNYIAVVVRHGKSIIHKEIIGLYEINQCKNTNKKKHEDHEITKRLIETAKHFKCEYFAYEQLNIKSNDKGKGKKFNKFCNNDWRRNRIIQSITKWCNIIGIKIQEVLPEYSSFIGQIRNEHDYDSVAAAIELSRRAWLFISYYIKKDVQEVKGNVVGIMRKLPKHLVDRWKKKLNVKKFTTYKSLYLEIKNSGYSYRNLFDPKSFSFRLKSGNSLVDVYRQPLQVFPCFK